MILRYIISLSSKNTQLNSFRSLACVVLCMEYGHISKASGHFNLEGKNGGKLLTFHLQWINDYILNLFYLPSMQHSPWRPPNVCDLIPLWQCCVFFTNVFRTGSCSDWSLTFNSLKRTQTSLYLMLLWLSCFSSAAGEISEGTHQAHPGDGERKDSA